MRIDGATALVAGGASGLGAATARRLAERGASVVIADLNQHAARRSPTSSARCSWTAT